MIQQLLFIKINMLSYQFLCSSQKKPDKKPVSLLNESTQNRSGCRPRLDHKSTIDRFSLGQSLAALN